jgi:hypothetical protein
MQSGLLHLVNTYLILKSPPPCKHSCTDAKAAPNVLLMPITTMEARLVARLPAVVAGKTYEDDSLSFRSHQKIVASQSARAHRWHIVAISAAAAHNPLLGC